MMNLAYDLHIHSCLSPCGDDDMTPANIAGMAALKGLDVVALTDHNTCRNCPAFMAAAAEYGVLAVPGMEINTSEEVHAVTVRDRDTMEQVRIPISGLKDYFADKFMF